MIQPAHVANGNRSFLTLRALCAAVGLVLALAGSAHGQASAPAPATGPPSIQLSPELARVLTDYENAYREGGASLAALFAEDGYVLASGQLPIQGRMAIAAYYGKGGPLRLRAFAYATHGDVGYILGAYSDAAGEPDRGKFTLTLRQKDGRWLIVSDMDNGNAQRPASPAATPGN
jgi:hypothetical protein